MAEEVIPGSRWKAFGIVIIGGIFVAIAIWMIQSHATGFKAQVGIWIGLPLFSLAAISGVIQMIWPPQLILRPDGFELIQPMRAPKLTAWREVEGFYIWRVRGNRFVAYRRTGAASLMGKVGRALGAQATLPNLFAMKAEDLAGRMETWRLQAGGSYAEKVAAQPQLVS